MGTRQLIVMTMLACVLAGTSHGLYAQAGRGAAQGAAAGAFWGLIFGGVDGAVEGAAVGAGAGAIAGGVATAQNRRQAEKAELKRLKAQERERARAEKAAANEAERQRLEAERLALEQERLALEEARARVREAERKASRSGGSSTTASSDLPTTDEEWITAIGGDNFNGLLALIDCERDRASALAKVGATSKNETHRVASLWLEAIVAVDRRDTKTAQTYFEQIIEIDPDFDTVQQASLETDVVVLEVRAERRNQSISCAT